MHIFKTFELLSYFICMGAYVFRTMLATQQLRTMIAITDRWTKVFLVSFSVLSISSIVLFSLRIQVMSGATFVDAFSYLMPIFKETHYGSIFILRLMLLVFLGVCLLIHTKKQSYTIDICMLTLIIGIGYTFSAVSHAADNGSFSVSELIDWLHVISTATWGGSILITLLVFYKNIPREFLEQKINIAVFISKLSTVCAYALLVVLLTGFYKIQSILNNGMPLWYTNYGHLLGFKLIFVTLLMGFGVMNRYISLPRVARWASRSNNMSHNTLQFFICVLIAQVCTVLIILAISSSLIDHSPTF